MRKEHGWRRAWPWLITLLLVTLAALAAYALSHLVAVAAISLFFVPVVLCAALLWGLGPAVFAVLLTIAIACYFFYAPIYSFKVQSPSQIVDLLIFSGISLVAGPLADRVRRMTHRLRQREEHLQQLYDFSRRLAAVADASELPRAIVQEIGGIARLPCCLFLPKGEGIAIAAGEWPGGDAALPARLWQRAEAGAAGGIEESDESMLYRVIRHGERPVGILAIGHGGLNAESGRIFLPALFELAGHVLERMRLAEGIEAARVDSKADDLREAIINSLSHDLRTPLSGILGSATTLEKFGHLCSVAERNELAATIREAAERLGRLIARLLDLTRIRAGQIQAVPARTDLVDVVEVSLRQTRSLLEKHRLELRLDADLPMPMADAVLLEQALVNVLDNAAKYSPPGSIIEVGARAEADEVELYVRDQGRGFAAGQGGRIFDQFYRITDLNGEQAPDGNGLGLAISRAFIEAFGGTIRAESPGRAQGTVIRIFLPVMRSATGPLEDAAA